MKCCFISILHYKSENIQSPDIIFHVHRVLLEKVAREVKCQSLQEQPPRDPHETDEHFFP